SAGFEQFDFARFGQWQAVDQFGDNFPRPKRMRRKGLAEQRWLSEGTRQRDIGREGGVNHCRPAPLRPRAAVLRAAAKLEIRAWSALASHGAASKRFPASGADWRQRAHNNRAPRPMLRPQWRTPLP